MSLTILELIEQVDKEVIERIANGDESAEDARILKFMCTDKSEWVERAENVTEYVMRNGLNITQVKNITVKVHPKYRCKLYLSLIVRLGMEFCA